MLVYTFVFAFGIVHHIPCAYADNDTKVPTFISSRNAGNVIDSFSEETTLSAKDIWLRQLNIMTTVSTQETVKQKEGNSARNGKQLIENKFSKKCRKLRTHKLRQACISIAENSYMTNMDSSIHAFVDEKEELDFFKQNISARRLEWRLPGLQKCDISCPSGEAWFGAENTRERSLSPWKMCPDYDKDRFPQSMPYAVCKCSGCMDPVTYEENKNQNSVPVKILLTIIKKDNDVSSFNKCRDNTCRSINIELAIGCDCVLPGIKSSK